MAPVECVIIGTFVNNQAVFVVSAIVCFMAGATQILPPLDPSKLKASHLLQEISLYACAASEKKEKGGGRQQDGTLETQELLKS